MRARFVLWTVAMAAAAAAYYVYRPLPAAVAEPWKLMLLDAVFRTMMHAAKLVHDLGLGNESQALNYMALLVEYAAPWSSESVRVTDTTLSGVEVRLFESTLPGSARLKRGIIYFHGGGWALGSGPPRPRLIYMPCALHFNPKGMRSYDLMCRVMAEELDAVVISVEYRLAPEAHFPEPYEDALQTCRYILRAEVLERFSVDPLRVAVSGDSAGGNLAAAVAQELAFDNRIPKFKVQALIYPVLQALDFNTPSYQQNKHVPILYRSNMVRFWLEYLNGEPSLVPSLLLNNHTAADQSQEAALAKERVNWTRLLASDFEKNYKPVAPLQGSPQILQQLPALLDVRASPLLAETEVLRRVPPAYIMTCEHDVLRDDGLMYARRLRDAGVSVTNDHYKEGFHGCMAFGYFPAYFAVGKQSLRNFINWLEQNL